MSDPLKHSFDCTVFFHHILHTIDNNLSKHKIDEIDEDNQDLTKWTLVDRIGTVYNRMVIFNAKQYHCSLDYFGTNKENGRLFQVFFFSTEK